MQPIDQFGTVTESSFAARVGMSVVDSAGHDVGTVSAVQAPGTDVRPDAVAGVAEVLMGTGYLRVDGTGALSNDVYVSGEQIGDVTDAVRLTVARAELPRATS
ncbi:hypothetical protein [Actinoplanes sp. G11-F43]|uniref:hypothetical protein n=1 Tax=Actinoplanes sp. G11-F43 TaxID=3424130 RepID=UPI003D34F893